MAIRSTSGSAKSKARYSAMKSKTNRTGSSATISSSQASELRRQLDAVQSRLNEVKATRLATNPPAGMVAGASTTAGLNAAQLGGASGVGFEDRDTQKEIADQTSATINQGGSKSQAGDVLNRGEARALVAQSGLEGILNPNNFNGLSRGAASKMVQDERLKRTGQISANTSFSFSPETLKQTQRAIDKFGFALDDITNDPFEPKEFKDEESRNVIELTSKEIGKMFDSAEQLYQAYNGNLQLRDTLDKFIKKGGSLESISRNITASPTVDNQITNAMVDAGQLPESVREMNGQNFQTADQYLASLSNPNANERAQKKALEELAPESEIAQKEIARLSNIPDDLRRLYFGDEKTMGVIQMRKMQAQERVRILEEQERDEKRSLRERADLAIEKGRAELEQARNQIEENRLTAKNYMTAQLAKLGALNTSGAAPQALQTIETKYQNKAAEIETAYKFAEREIKIGLDESIDAIENETNKLILGIEEDFTKDNETSMKEILKARQSADQQIYKITEQYARRLRERTTKYTSDLKKEAEKYAKEFAASASNGLDGASVLLEGSYVDGKGVLLPSGKYKKLDLTPTQENQVVSANLSGENTIRFFLSMPEKYRGLIIQEAQSSGRKFSSIQNLKQRFEELKKRDEQLETEMEEWDAEVSTEEFGVESKNGPVPVIFRTV